MTKKIVFFAAGIFAAGMLFAQDAKIVEQLSSEMVSIPGGTFVMGSEGFENNETPLHEVTVGDFMMSCYEVKQNVYRGIIGINYSNLKGDDLPVEEVSFYDALVFCNKASLAEGLDPCYAMNGETDPDKWGEVPRITDENLDERKMSWDSITCNFKANGYRLPTEAEWEYAACGTKEKDFVYAGSDKSNDVAWSKSNSNDAIQVCGSKAPNSYGLYDMSGNVWEWCWEWYIGKYDAEYAEGTDVSAVTGRRVRRGGSINSTDEFLRIRNRATSVPELRGVDLGFRVVRTVKASSNKKIASVRSSGDLLGESFDYLLEMEEIAEK